MSYRVPPAPGGKERHVGCLTAAQLRGGHEVTVAYRHGGPPPPGAARLPVRPTPLSRALAMRSDVLAFGAEVAGALRRIGEVDLVHLHGDHREAALVGRACRRLGYPLVLTVHGALAQRHRRLARRALGRVDAFIALGARPTSDLVTLGVEPDRILTASSGLDLTGIAVLGSEPEREPGLVVSVGALDPVKNHELVIEAVRRLRRTRPQVRLVIVGDGPERGRLRRLAAAGGRHTGTFSDAGSGVALVGELSRDEVYRVVARAQVFVLASRRLPGKGEGVPTAALEALALGTPVVLSSEASLDPVVPERGTYRSFESGSAEQLTAVLDAVLDDAEERYRMSAAGRRAAAGLDWSTVAGRVEEWYEVAQRGDRRRGGSGR